MILEEETYEKFGYYPSDLKPGSGKRILVVCDKCRKKRENRRCDYRPFCHSCAPQKSRWLALNNKKWLYSRYQTEKQSCQEIGKIIGCRAKTVWLALKRYDIEIRNRKKYLWLDNREWLYELYWNKKMSSVEIGEIVGCSGGAVRTILKKYGIKRRTVSEAISGVRNPMYGRNHNEKAKEKMSDAKRGKSMKITLTQRKINAAFSTAIRIALHGAKAGRHWEDLVGYTLGELMITLEKEFRPGMSWENYGKWHIDHIIALAKFKYDSTEDPEFKKAWALNNLQPLWADENLRKSDNFMFF